ncbi:hypothetical protein KR032_000044 [Drosophila birchii]|nr:hypothetical protein KR032_000044 [Drosophila birchii]
MPIDQLPAKLVESKISVIEGIMSFQGSTQVGDSGDKKEQLKQEISTIQEQINLPIGSYFPIPVKIPSFQMEKGLVSDNSIQVQELQIFKKSPLEGLLQEKSSIEEWQVHFNKSNHFSTEGDSPDSWHHYQMDTCSKTKTIVKKQAMKPLKHKKVLQKPKLMCLQGKSKAKSIKEILKKDNSNLLQKSKLYGHQDKSKTNSSEWFNSISTPEKDNSNWFRAAHINLGFDSMIIESKKFPDIEHLYDMKDLTNECENMQKEEQVIRNPRILAYDFQNLIKECENLGGDICEARNPPYESRYQSSNEVNVNELAGYLDNMLQIPREMSTMAKAMYI